MKMENVSISWFRQEHYQQLLSILEDSSGMPPSYNIWLDQAEKIVENFRRNRVNAHKIEITPEGLRAWCTARGLQANCESCRIFSRETMEKMLEEEMRSHPPKHSLN